jgi:hypothetical protein
VNGSSSRVSKLENDRDALGLDEDSTPEEVREQLLDTLSILRQLPTQAGTVE